VLTELSDGQSFQTYGYIELGQTIRALQRYLGLSTEPEDGRWQHAFYRNPYQPLERPRVYARVSWPDAFGQGDQARKDRIQDFRATAQVSGSIAGPLSR
jgi:hypothetical protein